MAKSLDFNGKKWKDITGKGLEGMKVFRIQHQQASHDILYVGTHAGVFYKRADDKRWKKLEGLPHAKVTDMEINHCAELLRVSTYGRGIWETSLIKDYEEILIEDDTQWKSKMTLNQPIRITSGKTLTVSDTVNLGSACKIHLEKNAKLIIDGGLLTNHCNRIWKGVWVEDELSPLNPYTKQSQLELRNGGQILYGLYKSTSSFHKF